MRFLSASENCPENFHVQSKLRSQSSAIPLDDPMSLFMLDTDTVSFALRGVGGVAASVARHSRSELCLSAITVAELRFGADNRQSRKIHQAIDAFLSGVQVLPFDTAAASTFGKIAAALSSVGAPIGQLDTLIASHALSVKATLVTNNQKHHSRVPGLRLANWM
jgi:tRNA(fMet)-specific endonuclease VapC